MSGKLTKAKWLVSFSRDYGLLLAMVIAMPVVVAGALLGEHTAQERNETRCAADGGRYIRYGDHYWSGLCLKPDGLFWSAQALKDPQP